MILEKKNWFINRSSTSYKMESRRARQKDRGVEVGLLHLLCRSYPDSSSQWQSPTNYFTIKQ